MKLHSHTITQGRDRAPARAMLKAIGFTDEDLAKPIIGVANTWIETMPCNYNLRDLAVYVKEGIRAAGGTPMEFNTIAISDGVTMGTEGMKASLVSREVIADSIELLVRGHMFDGVVALVACDKTIPGAAMALLRLNIPGVILYGGSILPGRHNGHDISIQDVFEAVGAHARGRISDAELLDSKSDDVCHGVAVPAFCQHSDADNATDITARRDTSRDSSVSSSVPRFHLGRIGCPGSSLGQSVFPTVSSVNRIHLDSSLFASPVSVSCTTLESTRIVFIFPSRLRNPSILAGGMPIGATSFASHSYITFAIAVFLQTRMKTGGRASSPFSFHSALSASHIPPSIAIGV